MNVDKTIDAIIDFIEKILVKIAEALAALGIEIDVYKMFDIKKPDDSTL